MERKRPYMAMVLAVLICLVTTLWGCQRSTTVILPPEASLTTASSGEGPSTEFSDAPFTQPTTLPTSAPTAISTTEPTSAPTMNPPTAPTMNPPTAPTIKPTTAPATEPTSAPTTEPTTAPTTDPTTTPTTEPTTAPTTEPTTVPPTEPPTEPPTAPPTEPKPTQNGVYDISDHTIGSLEHSLLDALNGQRDAQQLPSLTMDTTLCALAAIRAYECAESFSHTRPNGQSADTVLSDYDYTVWSQVDEQLHWGTGDFTTAVIIRIWMNKDAFAASVLSGNYTHIGIGTYAADGYTYIACLFAG